MNTPDPSAEIDKAVPAPRPSIMITEQTNPAAMIAVRAIKVLPDEAEAELEVVKAEARRQCDEINAKYQQRHRDAWNALESALDLNSDDNHSLCTDHLDDHGVAFVSVEERKINHDLRGIGGKLGEMLAQALGGRIVADGPMGGMIEVDGDAAERILGGDKS